MLLLLVTVLMSCLLLRFIDERTRMVTSEAALRHRIWHFQCLFWSDPGNKHQQCTFTGTTPISTVHVYIVPVWLLHICFSELRSPVQGRCLFTTSVHESKPV